ncbi:MAG: phosphoribosylglycinamide formyltransferase [Candidatus Zixiibacteriota bacterium]
MADKIRLAVFVSGGGTNLQSIIDNCATGDIPGEVVLVVSNKSKAYGLERAAKAGIDSIVYIRKQFPDGKSADEFILSELTKRRIDVIALAGYLKMLPPKVIETYRGRILNIHPALLPKFGGKGMYGLHVHRAVVEARETESGVTIHEVDEIYDHGRIVAQEKVPVFPEDTPDEVAARVLKVEHTLYPRVIKELAEQLLKERKQ